MTRISLTFLGVFFFFVFQINAQEQDTLSLKTYEELSQLINKNFSTDLELTKAITNHYIAKAEQEGNVTEQINGLGKFIDIHIKTRKFDAFEAEENKLLNLATTDEQEQILLENLYVLGYSYFYQGLFGKSTETHTKALELAKKLNNLKFESGLLRQLGYVKSVIGDQKASLSYQKEALALHRNTIDKTASDLDLRGEAVVLYYISRSYVNSREKDSALAYINEAIALNELVNDSCLAKTFYRTKGNVEVLLGNYKNAISNLEIAKTYCMPLTKSDSLMFSGVYGKAYIGLKDYQKAVDALQRGLDDYGVRKEEEGFMDDHYKLLAKAYKHNGNIEKSNFYFEKYIHTTEEFNKIQDTVVGAFKQQEIKEFEAELEAINTKKDNFKYMGIVAGAVILVLLFLLFRFNQLKKQNELKFQALLDKMNANTAIADTKEAPENPDNTADVSADIKAQILEGLQKLEAQEYFLKKECNSYNVAKKIKTNTSYLSKVINSHYNKNFNTYINDLRINYAILKLKNDSQFRKFSIQSIAEEVGYKSADSFTRYFKKQTGLNPSFFIKKLNNLS